MSYKENKESLVKCLAEICRILPIDQSLHRKVKKQGKTGLKTELFFKEKLCYSNNGKEGLRRKWRQSDETESGKSIV